MKTENKVLSFNHCSSCYWSRNWNIVSVFVLLYCSLKGIKYPSIVFFSFENGEYSWIFPNFSWGIFAHVTRLDQSHASENNWHYYVSQLIRALWLVNLAGRTLLYGLNLNLVLLQTFFVVYRQVFIAFIASKRLKLFKTFLYFKLSFSLKSNWLVLVSRCFRNLKPFNVNRNRQTHSTGIINILLTSFSRSVQ